MGRLYPPDELLKTNPNPGPPVPAADSTARTGEPHSGSVAGSLSPVIPVAAPRSALLAVVPACGLGGLALAWLLAPPAAAEPDLVRLLHGMVLIKGVILFAAAALVWWRLGRPIAPRVAAGYIGVIGLSAAALGWLWGLHLMLLGVVPFYGGLLGLLLVARRDRGLFGGPG